MTFRMYGTPEANFFDQMTRVQYGRIITAHEVLDGFAGAMTELVEGGRLEKALAEEITTRAGFLTKQWLDEELAQKQDQAAA